MPLLCHYEKLCAVRESLPAQLEKGGVLLEGDIGKCTGRRIRGAKKKKAGEFR